MRPGKSKGAAFEQEIADLLRKAGFRVVSNAGAARPRQTDLYGQALGVSFLVEAKNRKSKVNVGDVDALRSRLLRTSADVVGVMFTSSSLTAEAVGAIEQDRRQEILAVVGSELELVRKGAVHLLTMLQRKREALRVGGRVWKASGPTLDYFHVRLPRSNADIKLRKSTNPYVVSTTTRAHAGFITRILGNRHSEGVVLSIPLQISTMADLRDILGYVHDHFGLSQGGNFFIHQSETCWHGIGAEEFVETVDAVEKRYSECGSKRFHHSEDLSYVDEFQDGWVFLSSRQHVADAHVSGRRFMHQSELSFLLPGVPVDQSRFAGLCRYARHELGSFRRADSSFQLMFLKKQVAIEVLGHVVRRTGDGTVHSERTVVAVVAKNPFFRKRTIPEELQGDRASSLRDLTSIEVMLCDVRDWHEYGDVIEKYMLEGFETAEIGQGHVIRPFGTWSRITRRARSEKKRRADLERELDSIVATLNTGDR